jgi:GAF domain-containing protein
MRSPDLIATTFVELADTLVAEFDVVEFLHGLVGSCVELLEVDAAGLLLADPKGRLQLMASSDEQTRMLELFQLQAQEGPCLDCYRSGRLVTVADLAADPQLWPRFAPACRRAGYASVAAVPMRWRGHLLGAMNMFRTARGDFADDEVGIAQALTDVAAIGLLHDKERRRRDVLIGQLQTALSSRVIIEQAKGILAERHGLGLTEAFALLRQEARSRNHRLTDLAHAVVGGDVTLSGAGGRADGIARVAADGQRPRDRGGGGDASRRAASPPVPGIEGEPASDA